MSARDRAAWAQFWAVQKGSGGGGCLPAGIAAIDAVQTEVWAGFARSLPRRAVVLDLATGDGAVLRKLAAARPDLKLTGVDSAPTLPPPPKGMVFKAACAMEELSVPDRSVDAVTSQFGFEYGRTAEVAAEVARVLRPGGAIRFIVHHAGGPILLHNRARREALAWALGGGARLEEARQLARARAMAPLPTPAAFREAVAAAERAFPGQSVAHEFTLAVLQCLELGRLSPPAQTLGALDELDDKARNEIARIESLERAVCDAERIARVTAELGASGIAVQPPETLFERGGDKPFAWLLAGRRGNPARGA